MTNDVPAHDAILHPDFICLSSNGARIDRASYLRRWQNLFDPEVVIYWDTRDELITVHGAVALVRATNKHTERHNGVETTGMTNYTDTYLFEHGAWKCLPGSPHAGCPRALAQRRHHRQRLHQGQAPGHVKIPSPPFMGKKVGAHPA